MSLVHASMPSRLDFTPSSGLVAGWLLTCVCPPSIYKMSTETMRLIFIEKNIYPRKNVEN